MRVRPQPDAYADDEDLERQLRNESRSLDVDRVDAVFSGDAPWGATNVGAETTEWLVRLSTSGGTCATLIETVKDWLGRRTGAHEITMTIDGDTLELSSATPAEQAELINTFVHRH